MIQQQDTNSSMEMFSALSQWIDRKVSQPPFRDIANIELDADIGCNVALDTWLPLHRVHSIKAQSLQASWQEVRSYVQHACQVIGADEPLFIDKEEREMILDQCGDPPLQSCPLYFITVQQDQEPETIVYIGKTSSRSKRFSGGHAAISKLHDPKFTAAEKRLYLGCVTFLDKAGDYVPLEMIQPLGAATKLLGDLEMQLIYHFQPELNTDGKSQRRCKLEQIVHIQGLENWNKDHFLYPGERYAFDKP